MAEKHRIAVIYADDPAGSMPGVARPTDDRVRRIVDTGPWSVRRFWTENARWLDIELTWFLPGVTINPDRTQAGAGALPRSRLIDAAIAAATRERGLVAERFDAVFVIVHGGAGIEFGALGGNRAVVLTTNDHSTVCHEFGHVLGFDHSRGFTGPLGGFDDDYGSRYDVMAVPSDFVLTDPDDYFPSGGPNAGPMLARAVLFADKPHALRETGRLLEFDLHDQPITEQLWAAGRSTRPGQPELLVAYLDGVRDDPHRRLLVEYRQPDPTGSGPSRWDLGIDGSITEPGQSGRDTPGVVVHRIKRARHLDGRDAGFDRPFFAGTLSLEASDYDVVVSYPGGDYVVALRPQADIADVAPDHVTVTIARSPLDGPTVRIDADIDEQRRRNGTVKQFVPDLPTIFGEQEYERIETFTTWTVAARTLGVGGVSDLRNPEDSDLQWTVAGTGIPADGAPHRVAGNRLEALVIPGTRHLRLVNPDPLPETLVVRVEVRALDHGAGAHLTSHRDVTFEGVSLEESETLQRLRHWWWLKNHKQKVRLGPRIWQLRAAWTSLEELAPEVAKRLRPLMDAEETTWRQRQIADAVRRRAVVGRNR